MQNEERPTNLIKRVLLNIIHVRKWPPSQPKKKHYHRVLDISVNSGLLWVHPDLDCIVNCPKISMNQIVNWRTCLLTVSRVPKCSIGELETASSWKWPSYVILVAGFTETKPGPRPRNVIRIWDETSSVQKPHYDPTRTTQQSLSRDLPYHRWAPSTQWSTFSLIPPGIDQSQHLGDSSSPSIYSRLVLRNKTDAIRVLQRLVEDPPFGRVVCELHIMTAWSLESYLTGKTDLPLDVIRLVQDLIHCWQATNLTPVKSG